MRLLRAAAEMSASTEKELFLRLPTVPNSQKKAEIANILFNIMNEQRAKKCLTIVGSELTFQEMIENKSEQGRFTSLDERIKEF